MITETFELPRHWACAFNYGDFSGLEEDDVEAIEEFTDWMVKTYGCCYCMEVGNDYWFQKFHDASEWVDACDVSTFTFDVTPEK